MPPEYVLLTCECAGESLTGSAVARKLEGLGALTKGDKSAGKGETGGLGTNLENRSGQTALDALLMDLKSQPWQPVFPKLAGEIRNIITSASNVKQFLTRLQLVPFELQLALLRNFIGRIKSHDVAMASQVRPSDCAFAHRLRRCRPWVCLRPLRAAATRVSSGDAAATPTPAEGCQPIDARRILTPCLMRTRAASARGIVGGGQE